MPNLSMQSTEYFPIVNYTELDIVGPLKVLILVAVESLYLCIVLYQALINKLNGVSVASNRSRL